MAGPLPESYRRLTAFSSRVAAGTLLHDQGDVPELFYVVLSGAVRFEALSEHGEPEGVGSAGPGDLVGHVAALSGRPTSAAARVEHEAALLVIPTARLLDALRVAPELGVQLISSLTGRDVSRASLSREDAPAPEPPSGGQAGGDHADGDDAGGDDDGLLRVDSEYPTTQFFPDALTCPISGTPFEYLRVRTRAVRPTGRESDFHVRYGDVNPTWYGVVVCPSCGYAAYHDDFDDLPSDAVRVRLRADREARLAGGPLPSRGLRSRDDAVRALELAMHCYEIRDTSASRRALLIHRRAWLARDGGREEEEREWLRRARDAYVQAYESDVSLSEEAAARIAYLVGDLTFRLGDLMGSAQWLETAVRVAPATTAGITRSARDRLQDVRDLIKRERMAS